MKKELKVMCDFCADGLWLNGFAININELPKKVHFLAKDLAIWQEEYELLFDDFGIYKTKRKIFKLRTIFFGKSKRKIIIETNYEDFLKKGLEISKKIKKYLNKNYKIVYFDERKLKKIKI